jgi:AcrR family transcriptional regulator
VTETRTATAEAGEQPAARLPGSGKRGGKRRRAIFKALHDCVIAQGYAKTTLADVARAAGMSPSHLLYYFPGKDAILEQYFADVSLRIMERMRGFQAEDPERRILLLAELFFGGEKVTKSEIGFMLECFGAAVHDKRLNREKTRLDRFCKAYLQNLFEQLPCGPSRAKACAEVSYAMLVGLRTAAYFDERLSPDQARGLFYAEVLNLAQLERRATAKRSRGRRERS